MFRVESYIGNNDHDSIASDNQLAEIHERRHERSVVRICFANSFSQSIVGEEESFKGLDFV